MAERNLGKLAGMQPDELAKIGVEAPFADAMWEEVPFGEITGFQPRPFQVITGIPRLTKYRDVEEQIVRGLLAPYFSDEEEIDRRTSSILSDRITNYLRPEGYQNSSFDAHAVLLPFSADRAFALKPFLRTQPHFNSLDDNAVGIGVIYSGYLRSSAGSIGNVLLEALYFDRTANHAKRNPAGTMARALGSDITIKGATEAMAAEIVASRVNATAIAQFAVRNVYLGGSPGSGKRA